MKNFIKIFNKDGIDINAISENKYKKNILFYNKDEEYETLTSSLYLPKCSINIIEHEILYILEEITYISDKYDLKKLQGSVFINAGTNTIIGTNTLFSDLNHTMKIFINNKIYEIIHIIDDTHLLINENAPHDIQSDNFYLCDYKSYSTPLKSIETSNEFYNVYFKNNSNEFFLYNIKYEEKLPVIEKINSCQIPLLNDPTIYIDDNTGRYFVENPIIDPIQINIGFSSNDENIYQETLIIEHEKQYDLDFINIPEYSTDSISFILSNQNDVDKIYRDSIFYIKEIYSNNNEKYIKLSPKSLTLTYDEYGNAIYSIVFEYFENIPIITNSVLSNYKLILSNKYYLSEINLYAETEGEDERLNVLLNNFGINIDENMEYMFRESDINEDMPDYKLLNEKRKEMLLSYNQIYPYIGSYKSLFNILNYFGYKDIKIKEYFIKVDTETNEKKYLQVPTIRNKDEKQLIKKIYDLIPSKIWKKTPFIGLFFDINKETGEYDERDLPIVEESFQFSLDEILIKLFNFKEYLKNNFLPLNSRIINITGEGIYYEKIKAVNWSGSTHFLELNIGTTPNFTIYPDTPKLIPSNVLDSYYINEYKKQGYSGFIENPFSYYDYDNSTILNNIKNYNIYKLSKNFNIFANNFNENYNYLPPAINDNNFNEKYKYFNLEISDENTIVGSPILLEMNFSLNYEDCNFTYEDLENLNSDYVNTKYLTFNDINRGQYIECQWIIKKQDSPYFYYDSTRKKISDFEIETLGEPFPYIPCELMVTGMSGSSISSISIKNPGYGYNAPPNITILGTNGNPAIISSTVKNGYVKTISIDDPGYGYPIIYDNFGNQIFPNIVVDPPQITYETVTKTLHTVLLPYEGDYDIFLYLFDTTNNFTMQHKKCHVKKDNATFLCAYLKNNDIDENSDYDNISISDVYGTLYEPLLSNNINIDDLNISFDSLSYKEWINHDLSLNIINNNIIEINRKLKYIVVNGLLNSQGNNIYFKNDINKINKKNILIPKDTIGEHLQFNISGISGDSKIIASIDVSNILNINDEILYDKKWYKIIGINQNQIIINNLLSNTISNIQCIRYKNNNNELIHNFNIDIKAYTKLLITNQPNFENINNSNYYTYVDFIENIGNNIKIQEENYILKELILKNSSDNDGTNLYLNANVYSGDYSIKIKKIETINGNTKIYFDDINNELYLIDSNFKLYMSDFDVDYAKNKINFNKYRYESLENITIEDIEDEIYDNFDYNPDIHCGFIITKVYPYGSITIDENDTFYFSGTAELLQEEGNEYDALSYAVTELQNSQNNGISSFTYSLLPKYEDTKYLTDINNNKLSIISHNWDYIGIDGIPDPSILKIPAIIEATLNGDSVVFNMINPGYGYNDSQNINVIISNPDDPNGIPASLTVSVQNSMITINNQIGGTGYVTIPTITIDKPYNYEEYDNIIWTGKEWHIVDSVDITNNIIYFKSNSMYDITIGNNILMPFNFHKQLINNDVFNQFYYFIYASSNNYDISGLSYVTFNNGVEGEWADHPSRTYSYPFLNYFNPKYKNDYSYLYKKWMYEGGDMPIHDNFELKYFADDNPSTQNRMIFNNVISSFLNFDNLVASEKQQKINKGTYVLFSTDNSKMIGKSSINWELIYDDTNEIIFKTSDKSFVWFFTKEGSYSIKLHLIDKNGNISTNSKQSFIYV